MKRFDCMLALYLQILAGKQLRQETQLMSGKKMYTSRSEVGRLCIPGKTRKLAP